MEDMLLYTYDWENKVVIGQGAYSVVYKVRHRDRDEYFAVKQLKLKGQSCQQFLRNQLECLRKVKHINVVKLYSQLQNEDSSWEVLEYCDSNLRKVMQMAGKNIQIPEKEVINIIRQIIDAMLELRKHNFVHRDLKPQNILIKDKVVKLCDFGLTIVNNQSSCFQSYCGTPLYMSPQVATEQMYTSKADVWSLGIIFYEMLCGSHPWQFNENSHYRQLIRDNPLNFPAGVLVSQVSRDFIEKCLQVDEKDRMAWEEVAVHPLVNMGSKIVSQVEVLEANQLIEALSEYYIRDTKALQSTYYSESYQNSINMFQFMKRTKKTLADKDINLRSSRLIFQKMDTNKNGKVTLEEFKKTLGKFSNSSMTLSSIKSTISKCRLNDKILVKAGVSSATNFLGYIQFQDIVKAIDPSIVAADTKKLFQRLDKDEDHKISKADLITAFCLSQKGLIEVQPSRSIEVANPRNQKKSISPIRVTHKKAGNVAIK